MYCDVFISSRQFQQSRQDAAPTDIAQYSWERHVYMDVLMSRSKSIVRLSASFEDLPITVVGGA